MSDEKLTGYELLSRGEREAIDNMRSKGFAVCVVSPQDLTDSRKSLDDMEMMLQQVMLDAIHAAPLSGREDECDKSRLAESMFGGFVLCPHDGRTLAYLPGDDKVTCFCPQSRGGVHRVAGMRRSSAKRWTEERVRRNQPAG